MSGMASQITGVSIVYSTAGSGAYKKNINDEHKDEQVWFHFHLTITHTSKYYLPPLSSVSLFLIFSVSMWSSFCVRLYLLFFSSQE